MDKLLIYYNVFFFVLLFFSSLLNKKKDKYNIANYILLIWVVSAVFSIFHYSYDPTRYNKLQLSPYLYLQLCFLISILPIMKFNNRSLGKISMTQSRWLNYLMILLAVAAVLPFIENTIHVLFTYSDNSDSLYDMYVDKHDAEFDKKKVVNWLTPIGRICNSITLRFQPLELLLFFYYLSQKKINKYLLGGLFIAAVNPILFSLSMSGRNSVVYFILNFYFLFFLFKNYIPKNRKSLLLKLSSIFVFLLVVGLAIITLVRLEGHNIDRDLFSWVGLYAGEGTLNFNNDMWNILQHTKGDNSFSLFKNLFGFDTFIDNGERRDYWDFSKTGLASNIFYTYIGDWFSDLGKYGTVLFILILSLLIRKLTHKRRSISFFSLYVLVIYCNMVLGGFTYYIYKVYSNTWTMVFCGIIAFLISYSFKKEKKTSNNINFDGSIIKQSQVK